MPEASAHYVLSIDKEGYAPSTHVHRGGPAYAVYPLRRAQVHTVERGEPIDVTDHAQVRLGPEALVTEEGGGADVPDHCRSVRAST